MHFLKIALRFFLVFWLLQLLFLPVEAQVIGKQRSTLSLCGSSLNISNLGHQYLIQQSIGQTGIIGLSKTNNGIVLLQGFIQPPMKLGKTSTENCLKASIHPNPFTNMIRVSIAEEVNEMISVSIYNLYGRRVYNKSYDAVRELSIELGKIESGLYLLRVESGKKSLTKKLIKE